MATEEVVLVDERNRMIGRAEKHSAHRRCLLHRAFSIFLIDTMGRIVCQRRHPSKYHSGGLWANSCCGHPRPNERTLASAHRRLQEELGVTAKLHFAFQSRYCATLPNGMSENELVYVYFGRLTQSPKPNPTEIDALTAISLAELHRNAKRHQDRYATWLHHYLRNHARDIGRAIAMLVERATESRAADPLWAP